MESAAGAPRREGPMTPVAPPRSFFTPRPPRVAKIAKGPCGWKGWPLCD